MMPSVTFFMRLFFQLLLLSQNAQLVPVFNSQPSNPSSVIEYQNLTLQWSYNLDGQANFVTRINNVTGGTETTVASRLQTSDAVVTAGYENQFTASISDTEAILTILAVPRSVNEEKYSLLLLTATNSLTSVKVDISVLFKPENVQLITNITANNTCPGGYWNFTCSVGAANPQVTSYQLLENDIAVDTSSSGMWIKTLSNSGEFIYKCLANNSVGSTISANEKKITVAKRASVVRIVNSSDTVIEGNPFNVVCNASDELIVFWIKEDTDQRINGSVLNFTSINRNDGGTYRCEAENDCGSDSRVEIISVSYKPDTVELKVNTTENTNCSDLWVNFTCVASEANPAVYNFVLYEKNREISQSKSGMWIKKISKGGKHVYSCIALHAVGNVTSLNNVTLTVNVSASVNQIDNKTFVEGDSVFLNCNETGFPAPFVAWSKTGGGVISQDRWLNITNITKADRGQYQCFANNTCGSDVKVTSINVQFKPENVNLTANVTTKETCLGWIVKFTCTANANPAVDKYSLYENDTIVNMDVSGVWIRPLNKSNHVGYRCEANNSLGNEKSNSVLFIVGVPASVNQIDNKTFVEGASVSLNCNAMGSSAPFVAWSKIGVGVVTLDRWLNITNITKADRGQYKCFANNTCGSDVSFTSINVQYTPKNTLLIANVTSNETCLAWIVKFTCIADANPAVNKYYLYEDDTIVDMDVSGVWIRPLNKSRHVIYRCEANNSLGSGISNSITLIVGVPASVNQIDNETVVEGDSVSLKCNAMGFPAPVVAWSKIGVRVIRQDRWLNITSITKADMGQYQYFANNTCGIDVKVTSIKVQYPSNITYISANMTVNQNEPVNLTCRADGYPKPAITWSKDRNIINSSFTVRGKSDEGLYVCNASNGIGNASIKSVFITVEFTTANKESNKGGPPWPIIGGAIGAVVLVIIVIVVAWWVHRKRKCTKDTKIHNSESQVLHGENDIEDGVHAKVNGGYADAGPQSANGTNRFVHPPPEQQQQQQAAAAPPAYAVVDKSKKKNKDKKSGNENIPDYAVVDKSKKKKKKAEVEDPYAEVEDPRQDKKTADPATHDYASVDKSKKKKKEADENAYATVDKSKKSKKQKPKAPGEVLYADLDDFKPVQAPSMPTVSTSPEPLAPLKRPTPYQGTEYADITQFLKGNATLPEGQSTEMQPTYANAGGGQEAANKENANTGGEGGGGGDTEPKETPM